MKRPAVFFDRDNTLIANDGYLGEPDKVVLIAGAADAIARVRALGFAAVTISNQSGVARGMFTEEVVHAVNARMDELLQDQSPRAVIDRHEFCPFHPQATVQRYQQDSDLRKPRPGMILQAAERLGLELEKSWVIGDAPRDIEAGKAAGCKTILFSDPSLKPSSASEDASAESPDFVVASLKEAVEIIERDTMNKAQAESTNPPAASSSSNGPGESDGTPNAGAAAEKSPATESTGAGAVPARKMTFAERVRAGTFAPARPADGAAAVAERPKRAATTTPAERPPAAASDPARATATEVRPTEPVSTLEQLEPILQEILEEIRMMRQKQHFNEFSVTKLLAGIVQVLVLPALFFAYLHRDVPAELQAILVLAVVLQTMTIALLIMGRQGPA